MRALFWSFDQPKLADESFPFYSSEPPTTTMDRHIKFRLKKQSKDLFFHSNVFMTSLLRSSKEAQDARGKGLVAFSGKRAAAGAPEPGAVVARRQEMQE